MKDPISDSVPSRSGLEREGLGENAAPSLPPRLVVQTSPLLVAAPEAALLCSVSERTWRKYDRCGRVPSPLRWGKRRLWSVEELRRWIEAGCPSRDRWESLPAANTRTEERRYLSQERAS